VLNQRLDLALLARGELCGMTSQHDAHQEHTAACHGGAERVVF